ncbi:MAG TPA: rhodanese-like domain-containing protein [Salinibacter sp.]|nr:rhodanese-like domain-containing protein [Salinibacter sp.]
MRSLAASALCLLAVHTGCSQDLTWKAVDQLIAADYPTASSITTDSLAKRLADTTAARPLLLDARSADEYAVSHLPGARRVDPMSMSFPSLETVPRDTSIVVYCSVGYRSARVVSRLLDRGYTNVKNLRGSIFRWANEGHRVVRNGEPVQAVHPYDRTWSTLLDDRLHAYAPTDSTTSPD